MQKLIKDVLECADNPENWEGALDSFTDTFGITSACMFAVHEFKESRMNFVWSAHLRENLTPHDFTLMYTGGDEDDRQAYRALLQNPAQTFYSEMEVFNRNRYEDLPPSKVRDITNRIGLTRRNAAALNKVGPWVDGLFAQHFDETEARRFITDSRLSLMLPILAHSVSLGRTLGALKAQYNETLTVLDALGVGVFLMTPDGAVIHHNVQAQDILDQKDGLSMSRSKHLVWQKSEDIGGIDQIVVDTMKLLKGETAKGDGLLNIPRPSGAFDYLMSVQVLANNQANDQSGMDCAFVTVIDPARENVLSGAGISSLCDLTESETEIVNLFIQGARRDEVAERRSVSPNTIKTQLRSILQKTRCKNQSDLIRVAAATRIPVKPKTN